MGLADARQRAGRLRQRHHPASTLPITEWNTLEMAQGTAVSGSAKCLRASTTPSLEVSAPTEIYTVRATASSNRSSRAAT